MAVRGWEEGVQPKKIDFSNLDFWIQIFNLPLESINRRNGLDLARRIGKAIDADDEVCFNELGPFLRVRVGLNMRNPLPTCIHYKLKNGDIGVLPLKIENLGTFCFQCGKLGHERINCYLRNKFNPKLVTNLKNRKYSGALRGFTPRNRMLTFPSSFPEAATSVNDCEEHLHVHAEENGSTRSKNLESKSTGENSAVPVVMSVEKHCVAPSVEKTGGDELAGSFVFQAKEFLAILKGKNAIPDFRNPHWYFNAFMNKNPSFEIPSAHLSPSLIPPKKPYLFNISDINKKSSPSYVPSRSTAAKPSQPRSIAKTSSQSVIQNSSFQNPSFHIKILDPMNEDDHLSEPPSPLGNVIGNSKLPAGERALMPSGAIPLSYQLSVEERSDDDEGTYVGEYFYSYGELTKKRIRVTIMETNQKKISKWESNLKRAKCPGEDNLQGLWVQKKNVDGVVAECNSFSAVDSEEAQNAKDLVKNGVGNIGSQVLFLPQAFPF